MPMFSAQSSARANRASMAGAMPNFGAASSTSSARFLIVKSVMARTLGALVARPRGQQPTVVRDEVVVLVLREGGLNRLHQQPVELVAGHVVDHQLVQPGKRLGAERRVLLYLKVLVGEPPVLAQLVLVAQVVAVGDLEVRLELQRDLHSAARCGAE